jgi:SAM-dependent methyltransferase
LDEFVTPDEIFGDYDYFSSYSDSWVEHARQYVEMISSKLQLSQNDLVVEIASNDGYLLQHFVAKCIPVLGVDPAANVAKVATDKGVRTTVRFFGLASGTAIRNEYQPANLILGNNVLAHVPDINDFVSGMKALLAENGTITMEFPHLLKLIQHNQYDTIYHEHFSYLSLFTVQQIFAHHGLAIFDVEEILTHGGSLRIFAKHEEDATRELQSSIEQLIDTERAQGIDSPELYRAFEERVKRSKRELLSFLIDAKNRGKQVVGYGAPGKGNTLLNYCGIRTDFIDYTVDRSPQKQGKLTPGTRIPILDPSMIRETKPDYVLILPWNLESEIRSSHRYIDEWGGKFVVPIPTVKVLE